MRTGTGPRAGTRGRRAHTGGRSPAPPRGPERAPAVTPPPAPRAPAQPDRPWTRPRAPATRVTLARMHSIQRINQTLAQLVASLNVVAAVLIVLMTAAAGYTWAGLVGIIVGVVVGTVFAGVVCGVLALLINIRDLLADSLTPRP